MTFLQHPLGLTKEADDCMQDSAGRWFRFAADQNMVVVMEKTRDLAQHLHELNCIESPTVLSNVLQEFQDSGEVRDLKVPKRIEAYCPTKPPSNPCQCSHNIIPLSRWRGEACAVPPSHQRRWRDHPREAINLCLGPAR